MIIVIPILVILLIYLIIVNKPVTLSYYERNGFNLDMLICHVSDVHLTKYNKHLKQMLVDIKQAKPDFIFFTGDLIDRRKPNEQECIDFLNDLTHIAPVYFINGNHEILYKNKEFLEYINKTNVIYLNNEKQTLKNNLNIIGLNDVYCVSKKDKKAQKEFVKQQLDLLIDNTKKNLLLLHQPQFFDIVKDYNIEYVFSGHAHGGQVRLPIIGGLYAPGQSILPKYDAGWFKDNDTEMIISRGIGSAVFPLRIFNKPEVIFIQFKK